MHGPRGGQAWVIAVPLMCQREGLEWANGCSTVCHKRVTSIPPGHPGTPPASHPQTSDIATTSAIATAAISSTTAIATLATAIAAAVAAYTPIDTTTE